MKIILFQLFFLLAVLVSARSQNGIGILKGALIDSITKEPLSLATVTIFNASDTSIVAYKLSDTKGFFSFSNLPTNKNLRFLITMSGYKVIRNDFTILDYQNDQTLRLIKMVRDTTSLDEVIVYAERPPVIVRNDTIEFNANSFKYLPTSLVEDLLKKLPGVEVLKDGRIMVNGQVVNRILVDGREFFGGNIRIATRNLPANIIDKVQVYDDNEQRLHNLDNTAAIGKIVNLKLKKYIRKGWFGKGYIGGGTEKRFENGVMANLFRDTLQVSILYYANNLNRTAFTSSDVLSIGGFSRSYFQNMNVDSKGNVQNIDGLAFGGNNQGVESVLGTGINVNTETNKKTSLNLQYFFTSKDRDLYKKNLVTQFINDTSFKSESNATLKSKSYLHQLGGSIKKRINSNSNLIIRPLISYTTTALTSDDNTFSSTNFKPKLNNSITSNSLVSNNLDYSHEILYDNSHFGNKGTLSIVNTLRMFSAQNTNYNNSTLSIFNDTGTVLQSIDQKKVNNQSGIGISLSASLRESISKKTNLRSTSVIEVSKVLQEIVSFDKKLLGGSYDSLNNQLSDSLQVNRKKFNSSIFFESKLTKSSVLSYGLNFQILNLNFKDFLSPTFSKSYLYFFPYLRFRREQLSISYIPRISEPAISDLQPVIDNSNVISIKFGNINLKPAVSHNLFLGKSKYNQQTNFLYSFSIEPYYIVNDITYNKKVTNEGVQFFSPINFSGNKGISTYLLFSKRYKLKKESQINLQFTLRNSYRQRATFINDVKYNQKLLSFNPSIKCYLNYKDIFEVTQQVSYFQSRSEFEKKIINSIKFRNINSETEIIFKLPKKFYWETSINYQNYPNTLSSSLRSFIVVNLSASYTFLKNNAGVINIRAIDIFKQNTGVSQIIEQNFIQFSEVNLLRNYFFLNFTYNFKYFGENKSRRRLLNGLF